MKLHGRHSRLRVRRDRPSGCSAIRPRNSDSRRSGTARGRCHRELNAVGREPRFEHLRFSITEDNRMIGVRRVMQLQRLVAVVERLLRTSVRSIGSSVRMGWSLDRSRACRGPRADGIRGRAAPPKIRRRTARGCQKKLSTATVHHADEQPRPTCRRTIDSDRRRTQPIVTAAKRATPTVYRLGIRKLENSGRCAAISDGANRLKSPADSTSIRMAVTASDKPSHRSRMFRRQTPRPCWQPSGSRRALDVVAVPYQPCLCTLPTRRLRV